MIDLILPSQVTELIRILNAHGYEAYPVGECVRDLIIGVEPLDYDIITDASSEKFEDIFADYPTNTDNIYLGEIIVQVLGMAVLVSQFRSGTDENGYPIFTRNVLKDLSRRHFASDAIAFKRDYGTIDPFHGAACLDAAPYLLVAIGKGRAFYGDGRYELPQDFEFPPPFENSPESVLQAVLYYAGGDYRIEGATSDLIHENATLPEKLPAETKAKWLTRIIMGKRISSVCEEYPDVLAALVPELETMYDYDQHSGYHNCDLWAHTGKALGYCPPNRTVRFAALFHGIGKPDTYTFSPADKNRTGHYSGHAQRAAIITRRVLSRLLFDEDFVDDVCFLVEHHDDELPVDREGTKKLARTFGVNTKLLYQLSAANFRAKSKSGEIVGGILKKISENL